MDGAGATESRAAAELRAGEVEVIAEHPEQRRVRGDVDRASPSVDDESERRHGSPLSGEGYNSPSRPKSVSARREQKPDNVQCHPEELAALGVTTKCVSSHFFPQRLKLPFRSGSAMTSWASRTSATIQPRPARGRRPYAAPFHWKTYRRRRSTRR